MARDWHPEPEQASAWSAIGGVVVIVAATSAVLLAVQPSPSDVEVVATYACVVVASPGHTGSLTLLKWWPWHGVSAAFGGRALPRRIQDEEVDLGALDASRAIMRRTFRRCEIFGAVPVMFGECDIKGSYWADAAFDVVADLGDLPPVRSGSTGACSTHASSAPSPSSVGRRKSMRSRRCFRLGRRGSESATDRLLRCALHERPQSRALIVAAPHRLPVHPERERRVSVAHFVHDEKSARPWDKGRAP